MSHKLSTAIRRALTGHRDHVDDVHFHSGPDGRPFACDHARCDSASLTARELGHRIR